MEIEVSSNRESGQVNPPNMHNGNKGDESLVFLAWKDLTVLLPNLGNNIPAKKLLNGLSGFAEPGKIMAVMGPSGSGKSTLLDSLAGRLPRNVVMSGNVIINGKKKRLGDHIVSHKDRILLAASAVAYVTQDDLLLGTLTVKETLTYSAKLRLPSMITKQEINEIVEGTMMEMGLQECADNLIGNWHLRGISGGEKKRLSIALEVLTRPSLLFLDEPTSGLDSASAFFVVEALRSIARDGQRTIIASIHQPSSEVFALFDDLFLLSGGEAVYFGEAKMAVEFFHEAGIPCPTRRNPGDHFLRCINSDFDAVTATLIGSNRTLDRTTDPSDPLKIFPTAEIKAKLVEKYKTSQYATRARARTEQISTMAKYLQEGKLSRLEGGSKATWWKQLVTLTRRSFVNMSRDLGYYWLRVIIYSVVSISVGTIFFDVGTSYTAIFARGACGGFVSGFMTFMSIGGFPSFIEELKELTLPSPGFSSRKTQRHYGVAVYILSNFLSSFPFLAAMSVICVTITYFMVKMRSGFSFFLYDCFDLTSSIAIVESCMMIIAALVPNYLMGIITGAGVIGIMMMTAGFFRTLRDLPKPIWRYPISYINYQAWALQGAYKNDMIGLEFDPLVPGDPKLRAEDILKDMLGVPLDQSKWWDLTAVIAILISYRLAFFAILKLKERAIPLLQSFYAKRTIKHLDKGPLFPSTRQYNSHSLSYQEGLNSPMN